MNELIGNFGSDRQPAETQEREETPPVPTQHSPEADAEDEMQVDQETAKADDEASESPAETPKEDAPEENSQETSETNEAEPEPEPAIEKRNEGWFPFLYLGHASILTSITR